MEYELIDLIPKAIFFLFVGFVLGTSFFIVKGKTAVIVETLGKPHKEAYMPGLRVKWPYPISVKVGTIPLNIREVKAEVSVRTNNSAYVTVPISVQFKADDETPAGPVKAFYELDRPQQQIKSFVLNVVRQSASSMTLDELFTNRGGIEESVKSDLDEKLSGYGYVIENVLVDEPQPDEAIMTASNNVLASLKAKEAATNEAEAEKIRLVGIATADKESKKLQGEGIAQMRDAIAKGLSEAISTIKTSGMTTEQALELLQDTNRQDTLSTIANKGNMIVLDLDKSNSDVGRLAAFTQGQFSQGSQLPAPAAEKVDESGKDPVQKLPIVDELAPEPA